MSKKKKTCLDCIHAGKLFGPYVFCGLAQENHEYDNPCSLFQRQTTLSKDQKPQKGKTNENSK
jgi:hypothetical protein